MYHNNKHFSMTSKATHRYVFDNVLVEIMK